MKFREFDRNRTHHVEIIEKLGPGRHAHVPQLELHVAQVGAVHQLAEGYPGRPREEPLEGGGVAVAGDDQQPYRAQGPGRSVEGGVGGRLEGVVLVVGVVEDGAAHHAHQEEDY